MPDPIVPPQVSVVVPVFDEADNLRPLYAAISQALTPTGLAWELILVDDGSRDGGPSVMAGLQAEDPRVRVLRSRRNAGQSAALAAGFRAARAPVTVTLDADLQNDPADIPRLLAALDSTCDVVCGVRTKRRDSVVRLLSSRIANGVRNRLTHESIQDVGCTLRACRTDLVRALPMFTGMHRFLPTLLRLDGARIREIPVAHHPRHAGKSKYGIHNRLWRGIKDLFAVRWMQSRWIDRRLVEEVSPCPPTPSGSASDS